MPQAQRLREWINSLNLSVHLAFMHTFAKTQNLKIVEDQLGIAYQEQLPVCSMMGSFVFPQPQPQFLQWHLKNYYLNDFQLPIELQFTSAS